jgi:ADP-ribosylglycohydrolase
MLGAIAGDIIGSVFEFDNIKTTQFELFNPGCTFTDDTVLTVALADSILSDQPYLQKLKEYYRLYPRAGYGGNFHYWAQSKSLSPYNSLGNGSAMRVSPVGFANDTLESVLRAAELSAAVTHNHPEGIKGAQAVAAAIFLARTGSSQAEIKSYEESTFGYDLSKSLDDIRPGYHFDETCPGSVPQAITAFLESTGFEDAVRLAISLGGDSDTIACITGGIAQAYYNGVPLKIEERVYQILDARLLDVVVKFRKTYGC